MLRSRHTIALAITSFAATTSWMPTSCRTFAFQYHIRLGKLCQRIDGLKTAPKSITDVRDVEFNPRKNRGSSSKSIKQQMSVLGQVLDFLGRESIPHRQLTKDELHYLLHDVHQRFSNTIASDKVDVFKEMLSDRNILLVGKGCRNIRIENDAIPRNMFVLHICPTLHLSDIQELYKQCHPSEDNSSSSSSAIATYAWLNALLTNAFSRYNPESSLNSTQQSNTTQFIPPIVHLHQDVYNRNPQIVQSRLRSKCGIHNERLYARKTIVKRVHKIDYIPFLEENHLWGATGSKYAYGLYKQNNDLELVAVATFSSKRKVHRAVNMLPW